MKKEFNEMKRFIHLLIRTYGKWGIITFTAYFAVFYFLVLMVMPIAWFDSFAYAIGGYYAAIRYVSYVVHAIICVLVTRFIIKLVNRRPYIVRRKTLAFLVAAACIQLFSFFCATYVPAVLKEDVLYKHQVDVYTTMGLYWLEWIALIMIGYMMPFYVGALKLVQFNSDMMIASVKKKK